MNVRITLELTIEQLEEVTNLLKKWITPPSEQSSNVEEADNQPPGEEGATRPLQHPGLGESWMKAREILKLVDNLGCDVVLEAVEKIVEAMHTTQLTSHLQVQSKNKLRGIDYQKIQYSTIGPSGVLQMAHFSLRKVYAKLYISLVACYRHLVEELSKNRVLDEEVSFTLQDAFKEQLRLFWHRLQESGVEASTKMLTASENDAIWAIIATSNTFNQTRHTQNPCRRFKKLESWFKTNNK